MRLGLGLGLSRSVGGGVVSGDPTVSLSWSGNTADTTPNFTATVSNWQSGDVLETQLDSNPAFTSVVETIGGSADGGSVALEGASLASGTYYARSRVVRGVTNYAWSGTVTVTIAATPPSYTFLGENNVGTSGHVHTYAVDIGAAAADRYILLSATVQSSDPVPISVTVAGVSLALLVTAGTPSSSAYMNVVYGGLVSTGSGVQNAVVTWTSANFENKHMALWSLRNLASTTPKTAIGVYNTETTRAVTVAAGDLVFYSMPAPSGLTATYANTSTPAPTGQRAATVRLYTADWLITSSGTLNINTSTQTSGRACVSFA